MNSYLKDIIERKKQEVSELKCMRSVSEYKEMPFFQRKTYSLKEKLLSTKKPCIISEFKRASPSLGVINKDANIKEVVFGYAASGVSAISILTDFQGFQGSINDIIDLRADLSLPILRKEFIIDPIQVHESKAIGADILLLIASCLEVDQTHSLAKLAKEIGLEVLLEVHSEEELDHLSQDIDILGVNNRDLNTFKVDFRHSLKILEKMQNKLPLISESGLKSEQEIFMLYQAGYKGFLIGESFMKQQDPARACKGLISIFEEGC